MNVIAEFARAQQTQPYVGLTDERAKVCSDLLPASRTVIARNLIPEICPGTSVNADLQLDTVIQEAKDLIFIVIDPIGDLCLGIRIA